MSYKINEFESFNKNNLDDYLKAFSKEFRKINGKQAKAEIVLVGGAAILVNYHFRNSTTDIDAYILTNGHIKEAINHVGDYYNLPNGWLNDDFIKTASFSPKLREYSKHYRTFSNIVEIRTISEEYLIAMKLKSARDYKNDISDIAGILHEQIQIGHMIPLNNIKEAVINLYNSWDAIDEDTQKYCELLVENANNEDLYSDLRNNEIRNRQLIIDFDKKYPHQLKNDNIDNILKLLKNSKK
ncbi:MAG: DUF6036 family nucleotidyltransferase [Erysipelotrichaceae bacterium]|nr:DUF6036 family nucleotidyltransferase [Erysipelotrichaceae bacterium]